MITHLMLIVLRASLIRAAMIMTTDHPLRYPIYCLYGINAQQYFLHCIDDLLSHIAFAKHFMEVLFYHKS